MSIVLTAAQTEVVRRLAEYGDFASEQEALDASLRIAAEHLVALHMHKLATDGERSGEPIEWSPAVLEELQRLSVQDFKRGAEIKDAVKPQARGSASRPG